MRKGIAIAAILCAMLFAAAVGAASAETRVIAPEEAMVGEIVDIRVEGDAPAAQVIYNLTRNGESVFRGKEDSHTEASFRPRAEGRYVLSAEAIYADGSREKAEAEILVSGTEEEVPGPETVYSQKDGWWKDKEYGKSDLDNAGCAIFALSHALLRMGWTGDDLAPENLAAANKNCYTKNGTANARLITQASQVYGYTTKKALFKQQSALREALRDGDLFSFGIVIGHIALMTGIDEQGKKVRIADSAPSATFERIKKGKIYYLREGEYVEASDPGEIPGARYFFETQFYGGLEYYMDLSYCARRGGRLIRPSWLFYRAETGRIGAWPTAIGIGESTITVNNQEMKVATRELSWGAEDRPVLAVVTEKKDIRLNDADGKRIGRVASCRILPVLREEVERLLVEMDGTRGYILKDQAELIDPLEGEIRRGVISVNGSTSGRATVKMRFGPSEKHRIIANWKTGTEVTLLGKENDFWQVEAKGLRVWVQENYVTIGDEAAAPERNADQQDGQIHMIVLETGLQEEPDADEPGGDEAEV